jgi:hypothetical protein
MHQDAPVHLSKAEYDTCTQQDLRELERLRRG